MLTRDRLRIRRLTLRLKLRALAARLKVHESTVSRWENGILLPTRDQLAAWKKALNTAP